MSKLKQNPETLCLDLREHLWDKDTTIALDSIKREQEGSFIPPEDIVENECDLQSRVFP